MDDKEIRRRVAKVVKFHAGLQGNQVRQVSKAIVLTTPEGEQFRILVRKVN